MEIPKNSFDFQMEIRKWFFIFGRKSKNVFDFCMEIESFFQIIFAVGTFTMF